jgi:hypothetical protein
MCRKVWQPCYAKSSVQTTLQVLSHFCGQASSFPQAPTIEQKISPLGQSPCVCRSLISPSTNMLSHSWNLWDKQSVIVHDRNGETPANTDETMRTTYRPQFNGSTKVPGLSHTNGLQALPLFLLTFVPGRPPPLVCKSESRQGSEQAHGCTQAI